MKTYQKTLVAGVAFTAFAMANAAEPDGQWRGQLGAALNSTSGNTNSESLLINLDGSRQTVQDKISVTGYVNEGKSDADGETKTTSGKWGLAGQYDYNLTPVWFGFGKLGFEHDRVVDLSLRTILGAGLGYHWIKTPENTFDVYGGLSHVNTKYSSDQLIDNEYKSSYSTSGLILGETSSHKLTETVSFNQRFEAYPALTGTKSTLAKLNLNLSVAMTKTLSLTVGFIQNYNSKPAEGVKKLDSAFFTGINIKLGS